jgi:hypothetical protein
MALLDVNTPAATIIAIRNTLDELDRFIQLSFQPCERASGGRLQCRVAPTNGVTAQRTGSL